MNWWVKSTKTFVRALNYMEYLLILASSFTRCVSNSAFVSLPAIPIDIVHTPVGLKISEVTAEIKKYKSMWWKNMIKWKKK